MEEKEKKEFDKLFERRDEVRKYKKNYYERILKNFLTNYKDTNLKHYTLTLEEKKRNEDQTSLQRTIPRRFSCTAQALRARVGELSSSEHYAWKRTDDTQIKANEIKKEVRATFAFLNQQLPTEEAKNLKGEKEQFVVPLESIIMALPQMIIVMDFWANYFNENILVAQEKLVEDNEKDDVKKKFLVQKKLFYDKHKELFYSILLYQSALFRSSKWHAGEELMEAFLEINKRGIHPALIYAILTIIYEFRENIVNSILELNQDFAIEKVIQALNNANIKDPNFKNELQKMINKKKKTSSDFDDELLFDICLAIIPSDKKPIESGSSIADDIHTRLNLYKGLGILYIAILNREGIDDKHKLWRLVFGPAYSWAKYELYRGITMHLAKDFSQFAIMRVIFSFLIINKNLRFSNFLIRKKALEIIFEEQRAHGLWAISKPISLTNTKSLMITSFEAITPLLELAAKYDEIKLQKYLDKMHHFYEWAELTLRTSQENEYERGIRGWFPEGKRSKEPESWFSAAVLYFIKTYCITLSREIRKLAVKAFDSKKIDKGERSDILDSYATKTTMNGLFSGQDEESWSCILFGPPGAAKTTLAKCFTREQAKRTDSDSRERGWEFIQLTPGEFFTKGEQGTVEQIRYYFNRLSQISDVVVFFDEIEDLMYDREATTTGWDRRSQFVTTLLPRFQELRDLEKVKFIIATNHIELVDPAIIREGRVDLIIPIGHPFPYSRLNLLYQKVSNLINFDI
ncbi:MAG: ATP-binding protein, partial [Promethearchaeota archaeon]